jgi:membrane-associated protease RseP (regulator of RpoE activity)
MERKLMVPRVLIPVLGMIALALVVKGLPAQDKTKEAPERTTWRVAPAAPNVFSFRSGSGSYLGVYIREVGDDDVKRLNLSEERGALITELPEDGPAAKAGLRTDDVIVSWNGSRIESAAQLTRVVGETPAGRNVEVGYVRDGRQRTADVELADRSPAVARVLPRGMDGDDRARLEESLQGLRSRMHALGGNDGVVSQFFFRGGRLGVGVQSLGDQLADYFGATDGGALVTSVQEDSPAEKAGLKAGDVILRVGDERVEGPGDLTSEIGRADAGEVELRILRDKKERTVKVTLPERDEGSELRSGNAYFFGPDGTWEHTLETMPMPELPRADFRFDMPEIVISPMPESGVRIETPVAPAEPTIRT